MMVYGGPKGTDSENRFAHLYSQYSSFMRRTAFKILKDRELSEEAVQEAFIRVLKNRDKLTGEEEMTAGFLHEIAKNTALDMYRKRKKQMQNEISLEALEEGGRYLEGLETDRENRVLEILDGLPKKYRDVFLLKYSRGYTYCEIAEKLEISEANARQRVKRGKEMLWGLLEKMEESGNGKEQGE